MKLLEIKDDAGIFIKSIEIVPFKKLNSKLIKSVEMVEKRYRENTATDADGNDYTYRMDYGIERVLKSHWFDKPVRFESKAYFFGVQQLLPNLDKMLEELNK